MAVHEDVLRVARHVCRERDSWEFTVDEIVRALPAHNANTVRTHVTSRCCVNAPKHHPHRWGYFRRLSRGRYELIAAYRHEKGSATPPQSDRVAESGSSYAVRTPRRESIHASVVRGEAAYVAECLEVAVVTQGATLDEVVANLEDALALHLEGEEPERLGLAPNPRLVVTFELGRVRGSET